VSVSSYDSATAYLLRVQNCGESAKLGNNRWTRPTILSNEPRDVERGPLEEGKVGGMIDRCIDATELCVCMALPSAVRRT
jgi:hypothetical protein